MKPIGSINRRKGHNAERYCRKEFIELGFEDCITSRMGSKYYDDSKIDLMNLPINVQVKAGFQRNINPAKVLLEMEEAISKSKLPKEEKNKVSVLIFIKQVGPGNKRKIEDELVYMWSNVFDYFRNEFPYLYSHKIAEYKKTKTAIGIPFYHFKQIILKFYKNEQTNI